MELLRKNLLLHKLAIVDGVGRCGKSLLLNLLTCFESVEKMDFIDTIEHVSIANKFQKISHDAGVAILQTSIDTALYNSMIGRSINTRLSDDSSIYQYHSPAKYLQRSLNQDGPAISTRVQNEKPIYLCWTHDLIHKADLIFDAFQDKLLFFYINRRPIDIIYEWHYIKNYAERMSSDPTEMQLCIKYKNTSVPEIAYGWEDEFLSSTPLDRTIKLIYTYFRLNYEGLLKKQKYQNLHVFNFDDMVTNPTKTIDKLKNIINRETLPVLNRVLRNSNCPRILNKTDYENRKKTILQNASKPYVDLLSEMDDIYNDISQLACNEPVNT